VPLARPLAGVPDDVLHATLAPAEAIEGHKLTCTCPCYLPVMQYATTARCASSSTGAYVTRASETGLPSATTPP
jgi:oligopeptidase A